MAASTAPLAGGSGSVFLENFRLSAAEILATRISAADNRKFYSLYLSPSRTAVVGRDLLIKVIRGLTCVAARSGLAGRGHLPGQQG
jgi:hypothetical protein